MNKKKLLYIFRCSRKHKNIISFLRILNIRCFNGSLWNVLFEFHHLSFFTNMCARMCVWSLYMWWKKVQCKMWKSPCNFTCVFSHYKVNVRKSSTEFHWFLIWNLEWCQCIHSDKSCFFLKKKKINIQRQQNKCWNVYLPLKFSLDV